MGFLYKLFRSVMPREVRRFMPKNRPAPMRVFGSNDGKAGERVVARKLRRLESQGCVIINNVTLKHKNGSSQIDHIVISPFGIIVIETKEYKGFLFGSEETTSWMQALYTEKNKFYNPILQGRGHIRTLKYNMPQYVNVPFYLIVALAGDCEFKTFEKVKTPVVYPGQLYKTIINLSNKQVLNQSSIVDIQNNLNILNCRDHDTKREHIRHVNMKIENSHNAVRSGKCPRCGGVLKERNGKYGRFLGCEKYPKCRFTKSM